MEEGWQSQCREAECGIERSSIHRLEHPAFGGGALAYPQAGEGRKLPINLNHRLSSKLKLVSDEDSHCGGMQATIAISRTLPPASYHTQPITGPAYLLLHCQLELRHLVTLIPEAPPLFCLCLAELHVDQKVGCGQTGIRSLAPLQVEALCRGEGDAGERVPAQGCGENGGPSLRAV